MVSTIELKLYLAVVIDPNSMTEYGSIRDTDAETVAMRDAQDYLYQALHGWGGDAAATLYANMESGASFRVELDAVAGTDLPIWSEITAAMNGAIEDYNTKGFKLSFEALPTAAKPKHVKFLRQGKRVIIEYGHDLAVKSGVQSATASNILPLDFALDVPPVLKAFKDEKIVAHYRMLAHVELNPKS